MLIMESYWDLLPPELHEIILTYKRNQEYFDEEKKRRMRELSEEIVLYKELKDKWALGHISCAVECFKCCHRPCMSIYGHYVDVEHVKRKIFLAYSFKRALQRVNHVKSFL